MKKKSYKPYFFCTRCKDIGPAERYAETYVCQTCYFRYRIQIEKCLDNMVNHGTIEDIVCKPEPINSSVQPAKRTSPIDK